MQAGGIADRQPSVAGCLPGNRLPRSLIPSTDRQGHSRYGRRIQRAGVHLRFVGSVRMPRVKEGPLFNGDLVSADGDLGSFGSEIQDIDTQLNPNPQP